MDKISGCHGISSFTMQRYFLPIYAYNYIFIYIIAKAPTKGNKEIEFLLLPMKTASVLYLCGDACLDPAGKNKLESVDDK
ncbi:MAG: hypothetical protein IKW79_07310 [Schwartzia sp.]|nr:hypothetical protein [Schwartzia sp. (in: firmicutes)]